MGRAATYGIWSVFLYLVVTWLTVQGYIHLRMNMIPYPCTEQREGGGPWIGRESQVLFIFVNKWVMYFWWSSIRSGGEGGGWTSQSIGPDDSGYYYIIKRKVCSSLNSQLLTDNVRSQLISITLKIVGSVVQPACMLANVSMLDIHLIVNWQMSKKEIHWPGEH